MFRSVASVVPNLRVWTHVQGPNMKLSHDDDQKKQNNVFFKLWSLLLSINIWTQTASTLQLSKTDVLHPLFTLVGGDDSDDEEEVDSNNEGGSLQSERTDKDEDAGEGKPQAHIQSWQASC